jgi:hypothetical protein
MALLCDRPTGDKGQRYEVRARGWPASGIQPIGWSDDKEHAEHLARTIRKAPSCTTAEVWDRHEDFCVFRTEAVK